MKQKLYNHKVIILILSVTLIIIVVLVLLLTNSGAPESDLILSETKVSRDTFIHTEDEVLFAYNGVAFYKIELKERQQTTLFLAEDLPNVTDIVWGESGALIKLSGYSPNFNALYKGALTNIRDIASKEGFLTSEPESASWYIDFEKKTISFVSLFESARWRPVAYVKGSSYFVLSAVGLPASQPLLTFSPKKTSNPFGYIPLPKDVSFAANISSCKKGASLCMDIVDINGSRSLLIYPENKKLLTIKGGDVIYPTTDEDKFLVEVRTQQEVKETTRNSGADEHADEVDAVKEYSLFDAGTTSREDIITPKGLSVSEPIGYSDDSLTLFGSSESGKKIVYSSKRVRRSLRLDAYMLHTTFKASEIIDFSTDGFTLKTDEGYLVASRDNHDNPLINYLDSVETPVNLSVCFDKSIPSHTTDRTVHLSLDDSTSTTLEKARACLYRQSINPLSFSLSFDTTKSRTGPVLY